MKIAGVAVISAVLFFGAYRYIFRPERVKREFQSVPVIGDSPVWAVRLMGVFLLYVGVMLLYLAART